MQRLAASKQTVMCGLGALLVFGVLCVSSPPAHALTGQAQVNDVSVTVFAPDWTWQNRDVNILLVLKNQASSPKDVQLRLGLPPGNESAFATPEDEALTRNLTLEPGETRREAFTKITAAPDAELQVYDFSVEITADAEQTTMAYSLRTIRGAANRGAVWVALLVPAGVALVWCVAFAIALKRFAKPGAWKTPSAPYEESEHKESWIDQNAIS